jgi:hypothetical protein
VIADEGFFPAGREKRMNGGHGPREVKSQVKKVLIIGSVNQETCLDIIWIGPEP